MINYATSSPPHGAADIIVAGIKVIVEFPITDFGEIGCGCCGRQEDED
jgi:hypothetical protein